MMETVEKTDLLERIEAALETIRPFLRADGGNVELVEVDEQMVVHLRLLGACRACTMSAMTMKAGIEDSIRRAVPEIRAVQALQD